MLSAKSITSKTINALHLLSTSRKLVRLSLAMALITLSVPAFSQDNSPYTRYGIGDLVPSTNINTRGMGGIAAGYTDMFSINFNNPASYGSFQSYIEKKSGKQQSGRAIFDVGMNFESRTLMEPSKADKFTASNALFSYIQVGLPLKRNWGLSFGLRPISRISYNIASREYLPGIDSAVTTNTGDGGANLGFLGTGYKFDFGRDKKGNHNQSVSIGINGGYLFGKKDYSARRSIFNDSITYNSGNFETKTNFGNLYYNLGLQYQIRFKNIYVLTLGAYGNLEQSLRANQGLIRETYFFDENNGNTTLDSVYTSNSKGKIIYPSSFTAGFTLQKYAVGKNGGWLIGADLGETKWVDYRYFGQRDQLRNKWELHVGGELRPAPNRNFFSRVQYRAGFFMGPDYLQVQPDHDLPTIGGSFGVGLPLTYDRLNPFAASILNLAFEYSKRGNDDNILKENLFRVSVGFALSNIWFVRKKYE